MKKEIQYFTAILMMSILSGCAVYPNQYPQYSNPQIIYRTNSHIITNSGSYIPSPNYQLRQQIYLPPVPIQPRQQIYLPPVPIQQPRQQIYLPPNNHNNHNHNVGKPDRKNHH